ncbi:MAG: hypothetical protein ACR2IS_15580 [Nitrososphaeraceae archaeon]
MGQISSDQTGFIPVSKPVVKEISDNLNAEEVIRIATNMAKKAGIRYCLGYERR